MARTVKSKKLSDEELQDLVIESDSGARKPAGLAAYTLLGGALLWSLFQIWVSSPLPYLNFFSNTLKIPLFNSTESRFVHLSFALLLAFISYPAVKKSPRSYVPALDWVFAVFGVISVMYLYIFRNELAVRTGLPNQWDLAVSAIGIFLLLEAARRALGPPLVIIAVLFLFYTFCGHMSFMPDIIAHKGQSVSKVASHQWLSTEGVFGIALGVSTDFVFLFVLFGSLLDKAGAGNYFIKLSFSLLGHLRGGPAKAAVLASAMTGLISGSSIANVVTTGTFTIPLMRRVGFSREQAGAVEVASSVNGQIMPPVMGAAAFLMVEYVGVSYVDIVKSAFIPAVISYIALLYIVHLEALKSNMKALPKSKTQTFLQGLIGSAIIITSIIILAGIVYYSVGWIKDVIPSYASLIMSLIVGVVYTALLYYSAKYPPLEMDNPNSKIITLPDTKETVRTGLHYILPIIVLIWALMVERLSPGLSAFWATACMVFIILTQKPIISYFRKLNNSSDNFCLKDSLNEGVYDLFDGMINGARNMIAIGIATATAGIIVGSVSLTGIGQVMTELVEVISGGSFLLVLIFTAVICLILGMGLPTTANYIVVASLMAGVIVEIGNKNGMVIPLIAVHLFVFYFGIMADITPPVGLASFAAAAISGGDPIKTGLKAFMYSIRTVMLPFIFIYNTETLLIGVDNVFLGIWIFIKATIAILIFTAGLQGYFIIRSKIFESVVLLLVAFSIFRPFFWIDMIVPPYKETLAKNIVQAIGEMKEGQSLKVNVRGEDELGEEKNFTNIIPIIKDGTGEDRLHDYGLVLRQEGNKIIIDDVIFGSKAEADGFDFNYVITSIGVPQEQFSKWWIYMMASLAFMGVVYKQRKRMSEIFA